MLWEGVGKGAPAPGGAGAAGSVLVARDLCCARKDAWSFEYVSCDVPAGSVAAVLTARGYDARDFLLAAAGLLRPTSGVLEVCGEDACGRPSRARAHVRCGFFPGVGAVDDGEPVERALAFELSLARRACDADAALDLARAWLLATYADLAAGQLDPAARQRLGLALACAYEPRLVVADLAGASVPMSELARTVDLMRAEAGRVGTAFAFATTSPDLARAADVVVPVDLDAQELLAQAAPCSGRDGRDACAQALGVPGNVSCVPGGER